MWTSEKKVSRFGRAQPVEPLSATNSPGQSAYPDRGDGGQFGLFVSISYLNSIETTIGLDKLLQIRTQNTSFKMKKRRSRWRHAGTNQAL